MGDQTTESWQVPTVWQTYPHIPLQAVRRQIERLSKKTIPGELDTMTTRRIFYLAWFLIGVCVGMILVRYTHPEQWNIQNEEAQ